jgi:hypothetical protein
VEGGYIEGMEERLDEELTIGKGVAAGKVIHRVSKTFTDTKNFI